MRPWKVARYDEVASQLDKNAAHGRSEWGRGSEVKTCA